MSDDQHNWFSVYASGLATSLPMGTVLGLFFFDSLPLGLGAGLAIGLASGALVHWRFSRRSSERQ